VVTESTKHSFTVYCPSPTHCVFFVSVCQVLAVGAHTAHLRKWRPLNRNTH